MTATYAPAPLTYRPLTKAETTQWLAGNSIGRVIAGAHLHMLIPSATDVPAGLYLVSK